MCFRAAATVRWFSHVSLLSRLVLHSQTKFCVQRGFLCLFLARHPPVGQGLLIHEVSISHTTTHQSVGLLWTSDEPVAETSTWQHSQQSDIHARDGIRTHSFSKRAAADPRLRQRGHWDRHTGVTLYKYVCSIIQVSQRRGLFLNLLFILSQYRLKMAETCRLCEK